MVSENSSDSDKEKTKRKKESNSTQIDKAETVKSGAKVYEDKIDDKDEESISNSKMNKIDVSILH